MNQNPKNASGIIAAIAALLAVGVLYRGVMIYSTSIQPSSFRNFTAVGQGKVIAVPDVAQFSFSVVTEGGTDIPKIQTDNTNKMNAAIAFLKKKNISDKDIKTEQYSITPRMQYSGCQFGGTCPPPAIVGYTISQNVSVKIRNFADIGSVMTGVTGAGANNVSQLNFTIDDPRKVENAARAQAIADAQKNAQDIANTGGFSIGKLLSIEEGSQLPQPMVNMGMMRAEAMSSAAPVAPTVEPGSQEVRVSVTLKYEIR